MIEQPSWSESSLCNLCVLCVSVVNNWFVTNTTETQFRTPRDAAIASQTSARSSSCNNVVRLDVDHRRTRDPDANRSDDNALRYAPSPAFDPLPHQHSPWQQARKNWATRFPSQTSCLT